MPSSRRDPRCPFCTVVAGKDPDAREVFRTADAVGFFPTEPAVLGHTLVVPTRHTPHLWDLDAEEGAHLGRALVGLSRVIVAALDPDGVSVIQSNGAAASQTIDHVHVHVVPRWKHDAIGRIWPPETSYAETSKDVAWTLIATGCANADWS